MREIFLYASDLTPNLMYRWTSFPSDFSLKDISWNLLLAYESFFHYFP